MGYGFIHHLDMDDVAFNILMIIWFFKMPNMNT